MTKANEYSPQEVLHPGCTLEEKLDEMQMSQKEFAIRVGKPEKTVIAVLKGDSSITPEMAVIFENVTRIPAHFWMNKQARYNEYKARLSREKVVIEAEPWARNFPYREMASYGWVPKERDIRKKTINLLDYFGISDEVAWQDLYMNRKLKVAAYASLKHTQEPHAISAWLRQGELQAESNEVGIYNEKRFKKALNTIRELMVSQPVHFFSELQRLCAEAGVKVFYTPKLPKAPISGSTRWIKDTPVIQLTARYQQNDRFWFTFFHEAGHILLHGKKYVSLEGVNFKESDAEKEREAHRFAERWTFSEDQEKDVLASLPLTEQDVLLFASKFHTHPAMIIGRLQHKSVIPFSFGRNFIVPIDLSGLSE
jgi:addiction module HigA family antidote